MPAATDQPGLDDSAKSLDQATFSQLVSQTWASFVWQLQFDARFLVLGVVLLQFFRAVLIVIFRDRLLATNRPEDFVTVFLVGLRFDSQVAVWFTLPGFVMSLSCLFRSPERIAEQIRKVCLVALIAAWAVVGAIDLGFFHEFHDQFNHFAFLALTDDICAVLITVWKQHPIIWELLGLAALLGMLIPLGRYWVTHESLGRARAESLTRTWPRRLAILGLALLLVVFCLRGKLSLNGRKLHIVAAAVTQDHVLNKMVINPFSAIQFAIERQRKITGSRGLKVYIADGDVRRAARTVANHNELMDSVDNALRRIAKGVKGLPPKHVFFIMMESYSAWPTLERYRSLGLSERLMDLGHQGVFSRKFLSSGDYTIKTFASLVTGLPDVGVATNFQASSRQHFPSSISPIYQRLGMRTRMFMGGYSSWQRCGDFCMDQGFQEFYAAPHMVSLLKGNEWGPDDRELFDFVLRAVNPHTPSFNFIVTSSFHPPFSVDVYGQGFPHKEVPADLKATYSADSEHLRALGHLWYSDQVLGEFVEAAEKKYPGSLFLITGDHTSRKFLSGHPTLYERTAVPFVMYGPQVLKDVGVPSDLVGSHFDIMPTVFELLAPRGFEYHAVGHDLLDPDRPPIGFGRDEIIGRDFIASRTPGGEVEPLPDSKLPDSLPDLPRLQAEYNAILGVAWWRICRGADFPNQKSHSTDGGAVNDLPRQPQPAKLVH